MNNRWLVNSISLSRIPLSALFLVTFKPNLSLLNVSVCSCALLLLSDVTDGFLARKLNVASVLGRHWDSLGDKSFYVAVYIAFMDNSILNALLAWSLIVREIALYILRVLYYDKLSRLEEIRPYTNWHGYCLYSVIVAGFIQMYSIAQYNEYNLYYLINVLFLCALLFGIASIIKFLSLKPELCPEGQEET